MKSVFTTVFILTLTLLSFSMSGKTPEAPPSIPVVLLREYAPVLELQNLKGFNMETEKWTAELKELWLENATVVIDTVTDSLVNAISDYDIDNGIIILQEPESYTPVYLGTSDSLAIAELTLTSLPTKSELVVRNLTLFIMKDLSSKQRSRFLLKVTGAVLE